MLKFLPQFDKLSNEHILSFATKETNPNWFNLDCSSLVFFTFHGSESKPPVYAKGVGLWKVAAKIFALFRVPLLYIFEISTTGYIYIYTHIISYVIYVLVRYSFVHIYNIFTQMRVVHSSHMCHVYNMLLIKILLDAISLVALTTKASMYQMRVGFSKNGSQKIWERLFGVRTKQADPKIDRVVVLDLRL